MKIQRIINLILVVYAGSFLSLPAQDMVRYKGETISNIDYHHGQLRPAVGVHNIQVMRANRQNPQMGDGYGWTYNHASNIAYWNGQFWLHYLSNPMGEHNPPGHTYLVRSKDGREWAKPEVLFPIYAIPDGTKKEGRPEIAKDLFAVMHQRMGFYVSEDDRMLTLAYYGICMDEKDSPNDGKGIGRVVREIYKDGNFGAIYFIRYNSGWDESNTNYPFYTSCNDEGFINACDALMADPLMMQQWNEEQDHNDPIIPMRLQFKGFSFYHLPDKSIVGFWKHALTAISKDGGKSWPRPERAPGFVNGNAKFWAQQTADGRYAAVYNPSEFRWPLAVSVSEDGLNYEKLLLVNGEISTMRYGGNYKSYGPQYVRGILDHNGRPDDGNMWLTYSMNKEDIWVAAVPTPIVDVVTKDVNDDFNSMSNGSELKYWNIFSPLWARVKIEELNNTKMLTLYDKDPYDYALAERVIPAASSMISEFTVIPRQNDHGELHIEFSNGEGMGAIRLIFAEDGTLRLKNGYRLNNVMSYEAGKEYHIKVELHAQTRSYDLYVNGDHKTNRLFYRPVHKIERISFRTGGVRKFPNADTPTDQNFDVTDPCPGTPIPEAIFHIQSFKTKKLQ